MLRITLAACVIALGAIQATVPYIAPYPGCPNPHWCSNATQDWRVKCDWDECKTCVKYCGEKNYRTYLKDDVKDACHPWWNIVYGKRAPYFPFTDAFAKKIA